MTAKKHLSTGEVARICSVTPDTVYKWIRAGKIPAIRTAGGHHRIAREVLDSLSKAAKSRSQSDQTVPGSFQYCWEFNSRSGKLPEGCRSCIVYRSGTRRCYQMSRLPSEAGHTGLYCKDTCETCEYYKLVQGQKPNILIVTDREKFGKPLTENGDNRNFNLELTDCEYRCSMLIDKFRPDYVVIDCALGTQRSLEFAKLLSEDPRVPLVRIVLVGNRNELPNECEKLVYALVPGQLTIDTLENLIASPTALESEN